jgi:uncharacterized cupredoxin-like copper-binding protein
MRFLPWGLALALAGCGATPPPAAPARVADATSEVDWAAAERREIQLSDFEFTPSTIELEAGKPYILHLASHGGGHNFDAPAFFATVRLREPMPPGAIEVPKNEARDVALVADAPGTYPLECSHLLHADLFGMTGEIIVRPAAG